MNLKQIKKRQNVILQLNKRPKFKCYCKKLQLLKKEKTEKEITDIIINDKLSLDKHLFLMSNYNIIMDLNIKTK